MIVQRIKSAVDQITPRLALAKGRGEEATKQALVLPMLDALGYDIWNPHEVCPEYEADFAIKKAGQKEKVDLAILVGGQPRVFFEVKEVGTDLDGHHGQLARYFNSIRSVSLAILTDGVEYRFFTDTGDANVMDSRAFHVFRVDSTDKQLEILARFHKSVFSPEAIRDFATELNYTTEMANFLRNELDFRERDPSEKLVRWLLNVEKMYEGKVTIGVVERFRPIVKNALQIVLKEIVRRSVAAMENEVSSATESQDKKETPPPVPCEAADMKSRGKASTPEQQGLGAEQQTVIITTEKELECFAAVKKVFEDSRLAKSLIYSRQERKEVPIEIAYKDTACYFGIYLNRPSAWVARIVTGGKNSWIGFNVASEVGQVPKDFKSLGPHPWADLRVAFSAPQDLYALKDLILTSIEKAIEDRRP